MFGLLAHQGVGCLPWSPLAKGRLARPWGEHTQRFDADAMGRRYDVESDQPIVTAVQRVAEARGIPMAQVALAWVLRNPVVTAPIVGPTKSHHLTDAVAALEVELSDDEVAGARGALPSARADGILRVPRRTCTSSSHLHRMQTVQIEGRGADPAIPRPGADAPRGLRDDPGRSAHLRPNARCRPMVG